MTTKARTDSSLITSNAGALLIGRLAVAVMGWAGTVLIVRTLSESEFGRFSLVFSLLGMTSVVTELGLGRIAITGVTQEGVDTGRFAGSYVVLRACLGIVGYLCVLGVVVLAGYDSQIVSATAIAGVMVIVATPSVGYDLAFQAHLKLGTLAFATVVGQAAQLALTVAVVVAGGPLLWYFVPAVVAEVIIILFKMRRAGRLISFRYCIEPQNWWRLIREAVPLSIGGALVTLYNRVDVVMLSQLDTLDVVGLYGVSAKFSELIRFASTAVTLPILTVLVKAWPLDMAGFRSALGRGTALLAFFAGLAVIEFGFFAEEVLGLLYGDRFRIAGLATWILVLGSSVGIFNELAFHSLVAAGRNRVYPIVTLLGLLLNVALNLYLIRRFSFEGAAWATVATNAVVLTLIWHQLLRLPGLAPLRFGFLTRIVPVSLIAIATAWLVRLVAPWPVAGVATACTYAAAAVGLGLFGPGGLRGADSDDGGFVDG